MQALVEERLTTFPTCCNTENPNYRPCEPKAGFRNPVRSIGIILPQLSGIVVLHPAGRTRGLVLFSVSAAAGSPSGTHPLKLERYREGSRTRVSQDTVPSLPSHPSPLPRLVPKLVQKSFGEPCMVMRPGPRSPTGVMSNPMYRKWLARLQQPNSYLEPK